MAKFLHKQGAARLLLKLDITKAFDSIAWPFILEVLSYLGFGSRWRTLLCNLFSSSSTRILLNGIPGEPIRHCRGLRQGDPLSPMLFIIAMDVLSGLVAKADELGLLQLLAPRHIGHRLSIYADDVVMFISPSSSDLELTRVMLQKFGTASGLHANLGKSSIVPIQCLEEGVQQA